MLWVSETKRGKPTLGRSPRQRFPKPGIFRSRGFLLSRVSYLAGVPKLVLPKTGRFTAPLIQTHLRLPPLSAQTPLNFKGRRFASRFGARICKKKHWKTRGFGPWWPPFTFLRSHAVSADFFGVHSRVFFPQRERRIHRITHYHYSLSKFAGRMVH